MMIYNKKVLRVVASVFLVFSFASAGGVDSDSSAGRTSRRLKNSKGTKAEKELCVIGGGAAGAYTAYEAQKRGYDTVLIEPQDNLGGNCEVVKVPSTIDPSVTYLVNAAVVIYSPTETVRSFFDEMGVSAVNAYTTPRNTFVYGTPYGVFKAPPSDPAKQFLALEAYTNIANSAPYAGAFTPLPNFENLSEDDSQLLFEPFGQFLARNPVIAPIAPLMASIVQGYGLATDLPMWEIFLGVPPKFILQIFTGTWLSIPDGCQGMYDTLKDRMINKDPSSVKLNTKVDHIVRKKNGGVRVKINTKSSKGSYNCDDAVIAFRPDGLSGQTLKGITEKEEDFFGDLSYNGYMPSVFKMDLGPSLTAVGADSSTQMYFVNASFIDVGILTIEKSQPETDSPWKIFYQPAEPADTPVKVEAAKELIIAELTSIGFINIECIFIKNHKYNVRPNSEQGVKDWVAFFEERNSNDNDNLYWTGALVAGDASEYVWEHAKRVLDESFPDKS